MLNGKVAIVTGGTRGIGFATVQKFLENKANVILFGSRQETVEKALEKLKKENPDWTVEGRWPSLTDAKEVADTLEEIKAKYGRLDILVNNAGISDSAPIDKYTDGQFEKIMALNVSGVFHAIRPAVKIMKEQGGGVILTTSSMVSKYGQPAGVAYPTSKFALNGMTVSLARELGPYHIRVNAVAPGVTKTDMVTALSDEMIAPIISRIPMRRVGEPEDVANAFLFLASDLAAYISGAILPVDGAMLV